MVYKIIFKNRLRVRTWKERKTRTLVHTLSLISIGDLFLWTIWIMPGGCIHASPSTCTGTASSVIVIFTVWHCMKKIKDLDKTIFHCMTLYEKN